MSLPADYHTHTPLCRHATGEPTELAAQAVRLGLKEIGFSDHAPMPRDDFDNW
ncbi:MAG: PHP domain-containing protein, partial [Deltaproteobacteria bacterium]